MSRPARAQLLCFFSLLLTSRLPSSGALRWQKVESRLGVVRQSLGLVVSSVVSQLPPCRREEAVASTLDTLEFRGMASPENPAVSQFVRLASGVAIAEVQVGQGKEVAAGTVVTAQWVLRRGNGYFIDSSVGAPVATAGRADPLIWKVGSGKVIQGVEDGVLGMRAGGVRRILVPARLGYVEGVGNGKPGPMPTEFGPRRQIEVRRTKETFFFEVEVTKVRDA